MKQIMGIFISVLNAIVVDNNTTCMELLSFPPMSLFQSWTFQWIFCLAAKNRK